MKLQAFLLVAMPVIGAVVAAGIVLAIKVARRRKPPSADSVANAVPVRALPAGAAVRWWRWYALAVAGLALYGLALALH